MTLYGMIHGPELWLAIALLALGAACGIAVTLIALDWDERRRRRRSHERKNDL